MSDFKSDLPYIKWGLTSLLLALGVGGTAIFLSQDYLSHSLLVNSAAERKLTNARHNLSTAVDDRQNMASYTKEYAMLLKRNVIGNEHRLDWIDGLERLRYRNLVMNLDYTISPQKPYKPPLQLDSGNFDLMRSNMVLTLELLHEGQLMNFLHALHSNIDGWFMLDGCSVERNTANADNDTAPQLTAKCTGGWLTLKNRSTP